MADKVKEEVLEEEHHEEPKKKTISKPNIYI